MRASAVINATGVWAGAVDPSVTLRPSRGTHLVFDAAAFGGLRAALTVPVPGTVGRYVFALPAAHGRVYLGLTDEEAPGPIPDTPRPTEGEIDFLLGTVNRVLRKPLTRNDIRGQFAGLRPLLDSGGGASSDLSREHAVLRSPNGLITVVGGKLTTYRKMAADAVDAAISERGLTAGVCRTRNLPLVGAVSGAAAEPSPRRCAWSSATAARPPRSPRPSPAGPGGRRNRRQRSGFAFAVSHEGALDADDLLDRRTRIGLVDADRAAALPAAEAAIADARV